MSKEAYVRSGLDLTPLCWIVQPTASRGACGVSLEWTTAMLVAEPTYICYTGSSFPGNDAPSKILSCDFTVFSASLIVSRCCPLWLCLMLQPTAGCFCLFHGSMSREAYVPSGLALTSHAGVDHFFKTDLMQHLAVVYPAR